MVAYFTKIHFDWAQNIKSVSTPDSQSQRTHSNLQKYEIL